MFSLRTLAGVAAALILSASIGCSHSPPKTTPELSRLQGKKVALVDIDGEETARRVVEVALVNQLVQRGTFILVSKQDVDAARTAPLQDPTDWIGIARRAGADYALRAKVLEFDGAVHSGYSTEEVHDSQLAADYGKSEAQTERFYKVKSMDAKVRIQLDFASTQDGDFRSGIAEKQDHVVSEGKDEAPHLPPKLTFLENLSNDAFRDFFERYN